MFYFRKLNFVVGLVRQSAAVECQWLRRPGRHRDEAGEDMAPRACTDERVRTVMSPEISSCEHIDHLKHSIAISCKMKKKAC